MPSPAAYKVVDLQFADRLYEYVSAATATAALAKGRTSAPQLLQLATGMGVETQGIKQELLGWFSQWGKKPPTGAAALIGWPGLRWQAQVRQLAHLRGTAFAQEFLNMVIANQHGALDAATIEQEGGVFGPARQLASQIVSSSTLAIVHSRQLLRELARRPVR